MVHRECMWCECDLSIVWCECDLRLEICAWTEAHDSFVYSCISKGHKSLWMYSMFEVNYLDVELLFIMWLAATKVDQCRCPADRLTFVNRIFPCGNKCGSLSLVIRVCHVLVRLLVFLSAWRAWVAVTRLGSSVCCILDMLLGLLSMW